MCLLLFLGEVSDVLRRTEPVCFKECSYACCRKSLDCLPGVLGQCASITLSGPFKFLTIYRTGVPNSSNGLVVTA